MSQAVQILQKSLNAIRQHNSNQNAENSRPEESEIWETRDGKHKVLVLLKDTERPDSNYPITGVVIDPPYNSIAFINQRMKYPRYRNSGRFVNNNTQHPLDLVRCIKGVEETRVRVKSNSECHYSWRDQ